MRHRRIAIIALAIVVSACAAAYRDPSLFHGRIISQERLPAEEYAVYSAALREFPPDTTPTHDWIEVTGITIRPDERDTAALRTVDASVTEGMLRRLTASGDTVYLVEERFAKSLNVVTSPILDTIDWAPVKWQRVRHRPHVAGLTSLSRVAFDETGQTALLYGLWGFRTIGTGSPRVVLLKKQAGAWKVAFSRALQDP